MKNRKRQLKALLRSRRGFTLLECLCSLVLLTLLISAVTVMASGAARGIGAAQKADEAIDGAVNALAAIPDTDTAPGAETVTLDFGDGIRMTLGVRTVTASTGATLHKLIAVAS